MNAATKQSKIVIERGTAAVTKDFMVDAEKSFRIVRPDTVAKELTTISIRFGDRIIQRL